MPLTFEQTRQLFKAGRYLDIVTHGNYAERELATMHAEHRVLLAHAMFQAGQIERARQIVERERERASGIARSRYELLIGMLCRHDARLIKALQHYNLAFQIAQEQAEDIDVAWASLYRFRLLAQLHGSDELAPMLAEVRRFVARAGDPHAAAHMHDAVALMEASNGRTEEARRHLEISTSLIRRFPNSDLEQVVLISSSFVDFFESRFQSAVDHLNAARRLASVTGSRNAGVLECNLGHAMLVLGRLQPAETYFRHVLEHGPALSRFSALEGLARLYLAAGELSRCEETLEQHESFLLRDKSLALAFSGRWAAATHIRLLIKQGSYVDAAALAKVSLESAAKLSDRILVSELTCLLAEALVGSGKTKDGASQLLRLVTRDPLQAGNADAMYYRAVGFLVNTANPTLGNQLFRRARSVYVHQGNRWGETEIQKLIENETPRPDVKDLPILVLQAVASALANADAVTLVGHELIHLAKLTGCSPRAELVIRKDADDSRTTEHHASLELGTVDGKQQTLRFQISSQPHETAALGDLIRIGASAVALNGFRRERRQRAALWPIDPIETTAGALFLATRCRHWLPRHDASQPRMFRC